MAEEKTELKPGQREDGSFYLGRFKSCSGEATDWFAAAEDAKDAQGQRLSLTFNEAATCAQNAKAHGYDDWKLPPAPDWGDNRGPNILDVLFCSRKRIGGFDETPGENPASLYWSSTSNLNDSFARGQRFNDGTCVSAHKEGKLLVRLVRSVKV